MKIALFSPVVSPQKGGVADHTAILLEALGEEAEAVLFDAGKDPSKILMQADGLQERGFDAAIVQYTPNLYGWKSLFPIRLLKRLRGSEIPALTLFHEIFMPEYGFFLRKWLQGSYDMLKDRRCFALSSIPVVTCAYRAQSIFRRTGKRVPILPIFSNLPRWNGQKPSQEFLFAVFGRYHSDMRLSAILDVLTAFPGQKALFIGEAPAFLRSHPQVETTGFLLPEAAAHALHRARFFMLFDKRGISFRKGSSAAALRNGIPVVANHTEWTDPVFQDNVNVAFFDGSVAGAIARIKALLSDPDGCRRIGEEGNRLYEQEMSVHVVVQRIFRLFREART